LLLQTLSYDQNQSRDVEQRPQRPVVGIAPSQHHLILHVLLTDSIGVLNCVDLQAMQVNFDNVFRPDGETGKRRTIDIRSMKQILIGLTYQRIDNSLHKMAQDLDEVFSLHYASMACSLLELLFIKRVKVCFRRNISNYYLASDCDVRKDEILTWSVHVPGKHLNSHIESSSLSASKGDYSMIGTAYYMDSARRRDGNTYVLVEKELNCDVGNIWIRVPFTFKNGNSSYTKVYVGSGCVVFAAVDLKRNCDLRWDYIYPAHPGYFYFPAGFVSSEPNSWASDDYQSTLVETDDDREELPPPCSVESTLVETDDDWEELSPLFSVGRPRTEVRELLVNNIRDICLAEIRIENLKQERESLMLDLIALSFLLYILSFNQLESKCTWSHPFFSR
jgi:hypothetical protein